MNGIQLISEHGAGQGGLTTPPAPATQKAVVTQRTAAPSLTLAQQAARLSNQTVAAQVAAIRQQQQLELEQAQAQATQIDAASHAAAAYISGLGTPTYDSYKDAATTLAGLTGGFSGQLQQDASGEANKVLGDLKAVGGSAGQVTNTAPDLANVLYGTRGYQPAEVLLNSGAAAAARENAVPQSLLGYGQNLAAGALATGRTNANSLVSQILDAQAKGPSLTSQYLSQLDTQRSNAQKRAETQALDNSLIASRSAPKAPKVFGDASGGYYAINPATGKTVRLTSGTGKTPKVFGSASGGYYAIDPGTGAVTKIVGANPKAAKPTGPFPNLTKTQVTHLRSGIAHAFYGVPAKKDTTGKEIPHSALPRVSYQQAIVEAVKAGYSRAGATKMANRFYMPGQRGRPAKK